MCTHTCVYERAQLTLIVRQMAKIRKRKRRVEYEMKVKKNPEVKGLNFLFSHGIVFFYKDHSVSL